MSKYIGFLVFLLMLFSCTNNKQVNNSVTTKQQNYLPPTITVISDLPDSLQPKIISLDSAPKPRTIEVPTHTEGTYSLINAKGETYKINLEPPIIKLLPVLLDAKGDCLKDSMGNTFIMGNGGMSNFTNYTTDNGLALDAISSSIMDKTGNLWFGTYGGGVSRYDGKSFVTFSTAQGLTNDQVLSIYEDKTGNLWFATYGGGLSRYDGKTFTTFTTAQGLANNNVKCITQDKSGNLWFGTAGGGVSRYNPSASPGTDSKPFTTFTTAQGLANNNVRCIIEDKRGNLWIGTAGGLSLYDGKTFTTFTTSQGLTNNNIRCIAEDKAGRLWIGTFGGGVSRYDPSASPGAGTKLFTTFSTVQGLANNQVSNITKDKAGNLWFGTDGGGVSCFDGKTFTTFSTAQGLANNHVLSIVEDRTGSLWFGTFGSGLSRYDGKAFITFSTAQGLANNTVYSIAEDKKGNLWFSSLDGGVSRYDGIAFTTFTAAQGLANNNVRSIAEDKAGKLWFGTYGGGVSCYDGSAFTTFTTAQGLASNAIYDIAEDNTGNLWFGTGGGGVSRYDGKTFTTFTTAQGLANNTVWNITKDKTGNLWFATGGGGLSRYDGKSFTTFTTSQGLANNTIWNIAEDKTGNLWFATPEGLSVMTAEEARKLNSSLKSSASKQNNGATMKQNSALSGIALFKNFSKTDGLPDNFVTQVLQMPDGKMAIGTNLGITLFTPSGDFTKLNDIEIYNSNTACPVKDINGGQNSMFLDSKGIIWAGTGNEKTALVRFDPSALHNYKDVPTLIIKSVKVNEENICWYDLIQKSKTENQKISAADSMTTPAYITEEVVTIGKALTDMERDSIKQKFRTIAFDSITRFYPIPERLVLPYRYNRITIDFNAVETSKPNLVNYQYILESYENDWSPVSKKTSATFGNIHEGTYTFKVKAQGPNGMWCEPVTYTFKVLPPWYRSWWMYGIYIILFLFALRVFSKWRERNLEMEKEKLEQMVEDRTKELLQKNILVEEQKAVVEREKQRSDELLLNILPEEVAVELKAKGTTTAKYFDNVTVLFTDFVNFTQAGERMSPQALIDELDTCFKKFDEITGKYGIEKIKTIGDAYLAVAGLPTADPDHAENVVRAAIEIDQYMQNRLTNMGNNTFEIRIGIHSGSVVAGIVGVKKFAYDIWGDTVNTAARMEQNSTPGHINISETTYELVKGKFNCSYRGEIEAKGKGMLKMYYVA